MATATVVGGASAARQPRRRSEVTPGGAAAIGASGRRALPAGASGTPARAGGVPGRSDPGEVDERVIYRRPDATPPRPRTPALDPEVVDGVSVYRIYRPARTGGTRTSTRTSYRRTEDR